MVTKNKINFISSQAHPLIRSSLDSERGFVLITALFMLVALIGVVLICAYPLAHEEKNIIRHHVTLEKYKEMERGAFGRLAGQKGGKFNACGGYFSDSGWKVRQGVGAGEVRRMLELWCLKKEISRYKDIYRYDKDYGFWVGYRGKRYLVRPPGEEHMREKVPKNPKPEYTKPIFIDGYKNPIGYSGYRGKAFNYSAPSGTTLNSHPGRFYNPVEKLVINVNDHRMTGPLSARLIYAHQGDFYVAPEVVCESGSAENSQFDYTFFFDWDDSAGGGSGSVCPGATYQIGLKKLIIYEGEGENKIPIFTQAICVPPAKKFRSIILKSNNSLYRVEIDYE